MSALRSRLAGLALLLVTTVLILLSLEGGLRLFWDGFYVKTPKAYAQPHPLRGWANRPSVSVYYGEPEFSTTVTHNRWGYRSAPVQRERAPNRTRVLVLGDSFAYGVGVEDGETFSARVEQLSPAAEVINTGVNGYGTGQELLLLREEGLSFKPDVVVVTFFWNDVGNSFSNPVARFVMKDGQLSHEPPVAAAARTDETPEEIAARRAARASRRAWLRYSYAYRFLSDRAKLLGYWLKVTAGLPIEESDFVRDADRERAWELELALLREIHREVRQAGAQLLLMVIPDQVQVEPEVQVTGLEPADYEVQDRLRDFAQREQIALLDLLPALRAARAERGAPLYYLRDRHLLPAGQAVVARALLEQLRERGWLRAASDRAS